MLAYHCLCFCTASAVLVLLVFLTQWKTARLEKIATGLVKLFHQINCGRVSHTCAGIYSKPMHSGKLAMVFLGSLYMVVLHYENKKKV